MTEQVLNFEETAAGLPVEKPRKMTYEEYLALPNEGGLVEWVNEQVVYHMPPKPIHQVLVRFLNALLTNFTEFLKVGGIFPSPIELKCTPEGNSRESDLLFLSNDKLHFVGENRIVGQPDLIIEIVSDESVSRDFDEKFIEYQECGVPEYWIIDPRPRRNRALFYQLGEDGEYVPVAPVRGIYHSRAVPGFWLKVSWLWEQPDPLLTALEIAGFGEQADLLRQKKQQ
ncbi:MAG: Uma2 family endonuclease [Anaerolineales bacterium]